MRQGIGDWAEIPMAEIRDESVDRPMKFRYIHDEVLTAAIIRVWPLQGI